MTVCTTYTVKSDCQKYVVGWYETQVQPKPSTRTQCEATHQWILVSTDDVLINRGEATTIRAMRERAYVSGNGLLHHLSSRAAMLAETNDKLAVASSSRGGSMTLSYWPADTSRPILDMTAGDALRAAAREAGERTALVEVVPQGMASLVDADATDRRWTYAALLAEAENCAHWFLERYKPGERICIWAPNVPEWVIVQYGAALAGLVLVTANPALRTGELRYVLRQSQAVGLIHADQFRGTDMLAIAREVANEVRETFCMVDWQTTVRARVRTGTLPAVKPGDPAQVQYTSGTTGEPKGVLLHHRGLVTNASFVGARAGLDRGVFVSPLPLFHTGGSVVSALGCVTTCSTYVLPLLFDADLMLDAIERERSNLIQGVPTMIIAMLERQHKNHRDLSSLRVALCGGAPVPAEMQRRVKQGLGCDLLPLYGQTELSPIVCQTSLDDSIDDKAATSGRPLWQSEVKIADLDTGDPVPIGIEGEIQVRGYQRMIEYYGMPEATADRITADGWLRSGDLGSMDSRGYIRITGRLRDMIIRGGENIYPVEIEKVLFTHEAVADAAVFGTPDEYWGEIVSVAIRAADPARPPTVSELRAHCRASLAPFKVPVQWLICNEFPLTASGKVQKFKLRELLASGVLEELGPR